MAFSEVAAKKAKVPLIFKHMLAKLTVKVKVGTITNFTSSTYYSKCKKGVYG